MTEPSEVAGDIATAAGAISGLLLVFIGALASSFQGFQPQERKSVVASYRRRGWFAFVGLILLLLSIALSILGKWLSLACMIVGALVLLLIGLCWVFAAGILTVLEIK